VCRRIFFASKLEVCFSGDLQMMSAGVSFQYCVMEKQLFILGEHEIDCYVFKCVSRARRNLRCVGKCKVVAAVAYQ
jgi:hypothetical protein